jgi:hypothetical protein
MACRSFLLYFSVRVHGDWVSSGCIFAIASLLYRRNPVIKVSSETLRNMLSASKRIGLGVNCLANKPDLKTRNIGMEIQSGPARPLNRAVVIIRLSKQGIQFTKSYEACGWSVYLSP